MVNRVHIVGIGDDGLDGLSPAAREVLQDADMLVGPAQTLELLRSLEAETRSFGEGLDQIVECIRNRGSKRMAIVTVGDPLFYGTARFLCEQLGKQEFEVLPHVSIMQLAFARLKENWDEAYLSNVATQPLPKVLERIRVAEKVGLFTSDEVTPGKIAKEMLSKSLDYFDAYVCENLGSPDERITQGPLKEISNQKFSSLNVMVLIRHPDVPDRPSRSSQFRLFGNLDEAFLHSQPKRGLLTPAEVRSLALANLDLGNSKVIWDVGAGSGSVAIEAAQLAPEAQVYAIEMELEDYQLIQENVERFQVGNLTAIHGEAPKAWQELPAPDAIFVGGTGRMVPRIVESAFKRLNHQGRIVVNVATIENLHQVQQLVEQLSEDCAVTSIQLSRGIRQLDQLRFEAVNPSYLISATRS